jgi:hypothetical protein
VDLYRGLGGRTPGPTDCENLGKVFCVDIFRSNEGVVGVGGNPEDPSDDRLDARCRGRNIPDPGTVVEKYRTLYTNKTLEIIILQVSETSVTQRTLSKSSTHPKLYSLCYRRL